MTFFEKELIFHASPTLLGKKQASLFSLPLQALPELRSEIQAYRHHFAPLGIGITYLYCCQKQRIVLLVYREKQMLQYLKQQEVKKFLCQCGYPADLDQADSFRQTLAHLRRRCTAYGQFPHEIGFFLGYPPEDVFSFIREKGQNYKLCGCWKVYGNTACAKQTFLMYERCRTFLTEQAKAGIPLISLLETA